MPIPREEFKKGDFERGLKKQKVIEFLKENSDKAFRCVEIADETGLPKGTVNSALRSLRDEGKLEHKVPYWIWKK